MVNRIDIIVNKEELLCWKLIRKEEEVKNAGMVVV
jgi:hypothetical protein